MRTTNSNMLPAATQAAALTPAIKRQRIQLALDNFLAGRAGEADLAVFRDRRFMIASTADQACRFLEAAAGRSVPFDVYAAWADTLRQRWLQAQSGRRSGALLSQELVEVPPAYPLGEEEESE